MEPLYSIVIRNLDAMSTDQHKPIVDLAIYIRDNTPMFTGRLKLHFENILSRAIADLDPSIEVPSEVFDNTWPACASAIGLSNHVLALGEHDTPQKIKLLAMKVVAEQQRIEAMEADEAHAIIKRNVDQMSERFPQLGLTTGYIGNCDFRGRYDDRSWKVFTKLRRNDQHGLSVSFGGVPTSDVPRLAIMVETQLEGWCQDTAARLAAGEYRRVA